MKRKSGLVFLFSILLSFTNAQVNSPDLRCLKVKPNGDVILDWIIPSDPNTQFSYYVIYCAPVKAGPYSPIDTLYNYNTSNYTHVGANANVQSKYYFILTKYNNAGLKSSNPKDTLRSIWIGLLSISGAKDIKLLYNDLHQPKLSTSSTFTISKEYPVGTWNVLKVWPDNNYADTISVCTASINYKVSMADASGCLSESNINGGLYNDTKSPDEPIIDSISVLPNGNTILAWRIPYDKDIFKYEIQIGTVVGTNSINIKLDSLSGRNHSSYTYTSVAATLTRTSIFVAAIDSCNRSSTANYTLNTMFLIAKYYSCDYKTELVWNPYLSMPLGLKEYQIFHSIDGGAFEKIGTTTLTAFTHSGVSPGKNVKYFIRAINKDKTITSSSNRVSFLSYLVKTPNYIYIPSVSVVDKTTVLIKIFIDTSKESNGIDILRSEDGNNFKPITFLPYGGSPNLSYYDDNVEPLKRSYYYKLQLRDSCGNTRIISNVCKTILLKVKEDENQIFTKHLSWNEYEGFAAGVKNYRIYRVLNDVVETNPIGTTSVSLTQFTDNVESISDLGTKIEYYVEAIETGIGNPFGISDISRSNLADIYMEGSLFIPNAFAPNGVNNKWRPIPNFIDKSDYLIRIFDRWGQQIFKTTSDTEAWDGLNYPNDIYVYIISYKNSRGEYKEAKGTLLLMR